MLPRLGVVGRGYFGKRIIRALRDKYEIRFITGKERAIDFDIDWAIVASSTESHYSLVRLFLEKRINVFCAKPLSLSYDQSVELVGLAKTNNTNLYVDDVFRYRNAFRSFKLRTPDSDSFEISWSKQGSFSDNIGNSLIYHDLYLLIDLLGDLKVSGYRSDVNRMNHKRFSFSSGRRRFSFDYNRSAPLVRKEWRVGAQVLDFSRADNDALSEMLTVVLSGEADIAYNNALALKAQRVLQELLEDIPTVAVVGAGIFGISAALKLDEAGLDVELFERKNAILSSASSINQCRLHRGYHYPRSKDTARSAKVGTVSFLKKYPCESPGNQLYYSIAAIGSRTTPRQFQEFMDSEGLAYKTVKLDLVRDDAISVTFKVDEALFDPARLSGICSRCLDDSGVAVRCGREFTRELAAQYDYVVNTTYSNMNSLLDESFQTDYQFEVCEKPVVRLPDEYRGIGVVICDGPFMCIDPYGSTPYHVMGNVVHAIHATNVGRFPVIPPALAPLLDRGIIDRPQITKIEKFIETAKKYFVGIEKAVHVGSMFTVRAVLPNRDYDDARPSLVTKHSDGLYSMFSGKISTCVDSADDLLRYISMT